LAREAKIKQVSELFTDVRIRFVTYCDHSHVFCDSVSCMAGVRWILTVVEMVT